MRTAQVVTTRIAKYCRPGTSVTLVSDAIQAGEDVNEPATSDVAIAGATPLILASFFNLVDIARLLLNAGASVDKVDRYGKTAIMRAVEQGSRETCQLLLQYGAQLSSEYQLIYAAQVGDPTEVRRLLESGLSIHTRDWGTEDTRGGTPVRWAASFGHSDVVKLLLHSETGELEAAVTLALIEGNQTIVDLLDEELSRRQRLSTPP
jgi:ankyrin repeat protein